MALFEVEGWDIKADKVAFDKADKKAEEKKLKRKQKKQQHLERKHADEQSENFKGKKRSQKESIGKEEHMQEPHSPMNDEPLQKRQMIARKQELTPLQQKMMAKLQGSRFRWINEQLYTITSQEALNLIKEQPQLFDEYHDGFRSQVQSWPENPVDVFVDQVRQRSMKPVNAPGGLPGLQKTKEVVIADMGCGEAQLALDVNNFFAQHNKKSSNKKKIFHKVHSFDLKKVNDRITVADIKNVPLPDESCSIVIFCLSLMGTNFLDFVKEAYRILIPRGELWIAEIKSRFSENDPMHSGDEFVNALKLMGFFHKKTFEKENKMFTRFEFFKPSAEIIAERKQKLERRKKFIEVESEKEELENHRKQMAEGKWLLKPCIYKRR